MKRRYWLNHRDAFHIIADLYNVDALLASRLANDLVRGDSRQTSCSLSRILEMIGRINASPELQYALIEKNTERIMRTRGTR